MPPQGERKSAPPPGHATESLPPPPPPILPSATAPNLIQGLPFPVNTTMSVPIFGARKLAQKLLDQQREFIAYVSYLQELIHRTGGMSILQIEERVRQLTDEHSRSTQAYEEYRRSAYEVLKKEVSSAKATSEQEVSKARSYVQNSYDLARNELAQHQKDVTSLKSEVINLRALALTQEVGLYEFEHPAEDSARFANELKSVREEIKRMVRGGAYSSASNFSFNNSAKQGDKFMKQMGKMLLSSYNAEAENGVKSVKAGNLDAAQARLEKALVRIEKNGEMISLRIKPHYHKLRLKEMSLAAQHLEAVKALKEEEKEHRADLREQAKVEAEVRKQREKLEKERKHKENVRDALIQRISAAEQPSEDDLAKVEELEISIEEISEAEQDVERRGANIRAGYVYVVSNIGSFGEGIVKIGMTRRLEPMDRIKELSGSNVPFGFDVHALFFSEDAYGIEAMLHRTFAQQKVNLVNTRREHFYTTPAAVLHELKASNVAVVEYKVEADAEDYHKSNLVRAASAQQV